MVATIILVAAKGGGRYALELHPQANELLVTVSGQNGYEEMAKDPVRKKLVEYIMPSTPIMRIFLE